MAASSVATPTNGNDSSEWLRIQRKDQRGAVAREEAEVLAVRRIARQRDEAHDARGETAATQILIEALARILRVTLPLLHRCDVAASHRGSCWIPVIGTAIAPPVASALWPGMITDR